MPLDHNDNSGSHGSPELKRFTDPWYKIRDGFIGAAATLTIFLGGAALEVEESCAPDGLCSEDIGFDFSADNRLERDLWAVLVFSGVSAGISEVVRREAASNEQ
jgi:hypothetical protein